MSAIAHLRGHLCEYQEKENRWVFADTKNPIGDEIRPCKKCGGMPTPEGYDACLGYIPGATSACCGHGVGKGFVL